MSDWTTVIPGPGMVQETARALLALADRPEDVMTQGGGNEFRIPPYLATRYEAPADPAPRRRRAKKEGDE
jgi:hypothetical protein